MPNEQEVPIYDADNPITVLLVDDYPMWVKAVRDTLDAEDDIIVVGEVNDGNDVLDAIAAYRPHVVVLDVNLPHMNGMEIVSRLKTDKQNTASVVMLTAYQDWEQELHAIRYGASGFCSKDIRPDRLVSVVREVAAGGYVVGEQNYDAQGINNWAAEVVESLIGPNSIDADENYTPLSPREMEILRHVTSGKSNLEIASTLDISHQTVKNHMTSILRKLDVQDRTQAAVTAIWRGWVRRDDMLE